ncbi:hypothetical protein [Mitsuaria sp. 7]|nr:hypothetical protein [Mitsuaria sp. 7]
MPIRPARFSPAVALIGAAFLLGASLAHAVDLDVEISGVTRHAIQLPAKR